MGLSDDLNLMSSEPADVAATCNALHALLLQHQKDAQYKEQLRQEMSRARTEAKAMEKERTKLENALSTKEREIGSLANKAKAGDDARKEEVGRARRDADELQKRLLGSDRRLVQMQHEIKRKEKEYERLQERLSHYLADKKRNESAALDMAGQLAQSAVSTITGVSRSSSSAAVRSDEGLKAVVAAYEGKHSELARENKDLRAALSSLQAEYKEALNASIARREIDVAAGPVVDDTFLTAVPMMNGDELRAELASKLKVLKRRLGNLTWQGHADGREPGSVAEQRLASDLTIAKSVIRDQEQVIASVLGALRTAQLAQDAEYQVEIKGLALRYQGQLAAAEAALVRTEGEAAKGRTVAIALAECENSLAQMSQQRDDAYRRCEKAQETARGAEMELASALQQASAHADARAATAAAAARQQIEVEMSEMAAESTERNLSLKREQASLRAETGALRERLIAEKAAAAKAFAARDEAVATLEARMEEAENMGASRGRAELRVVVGEKEAELHQLAAKVAATEAAVMAAHEQTEQLRVRMTEDTNARLAQVQQEHDAALRALKTSHAVALTALETKMMAALSGAVREKERLQAAMDEVRSRADAETADLNARLSQSSAALIDREAALKRSLTQAHSAEIEALKRSIVNDRATLLAKAESDFVQEREVLVERAAQLQAQLDAERCALRGREDQLRSEAIKAAEAMEAAKRYNEMTIHYKDLMCKYAPGIGAGVFLEKAVERRAAGMVAITATSGGVKMAQQSKRGVRV